MTDRPVAGTDADAHPAPPSRDELFDQSHVEHYPEVEYSSAYDHDDSYDGHEAGHDDGHEYGHEYGDELHDPHGYGHDDEPVFGDPPLGRSERRRRRSRGKRRRTTGLLVMLLALVVVGGSAFAASTVLRPWISDMRDGGASDYPGPGTDAVTFTVNDGDAGRTIGANLVKAGVVKSAKAFTDAAAADPRAAGIQPGDYGLKKEMSAAGALAVLVDPANRIAPKVTIREGLWMSETFALLSSKTGVPLADYQTAAKDPTALGLPSEAGGNLEGYLFPATYEFPKGASAADQLRTMIARAVAELTAAGVTPAQMEQVVITASIVEAEARLDADRPKIARVIANRLADGMKLQLDSTVSYGVQRRAITTTDAERAAKNIWNTYANAGLPGGPISNPGRASIDAVLHPAAGPWMYFVAVNPTTGETVFSTTAAEHDAAVAQFHAWCDQNKGQC